MTRIQSLFSSLNHAVHRNRADNDLHLDFREQCHIDFNASISLAGSLLDPAAHDLRHSHAGHTEFVHSLSQLVIPGKFCDDDNFRNTGSNSGDICTVCSYNGDGRILLRRGSLLVAVGSQICVLIDTHRHGTGDIHDGKSRIGGGKTMLCGIKAHDFFLLRDSEPYCHPDHGKCDINRDDCPERRNKHSAELLA